MNTADNIYQNVQDLPEPYALAVLHFTEFLIFKNQERDKKIQQRIEQANNGLGITLDNDYIDNLNQRVSERLAANKKS